MLHSRFTVAGRTLLRVNMTAPPHDGQRSTCPKAVFPLWFAKTPIAFEINGIEAS